MELHCQTGAAAIYVLPLQVEAMTMADRIVILNDGEIEQIGSPIEVYSRPANKFVAGFFRSPQKKFIPPVVEDRKTGQISCNSGEGGTPRLPLPESQSPLRQTINPRVWPAKCRTLSSA